MSAQSAQDRDQLVPELGRKMGRRQTGEQLLCVCQLRARVLHSARLVGSTADHPHSHQLRSRFSQSRQLGSAHTGISGDSFEIAHGRRALLGQVIQRHRRACKSHQRLLGRRERSRHNRLLLCIPSYRCYQIGTSGVATSSCARHQRLHILTLGELIHELGSCHQPTFPELHRSGRRARYCSHQARRIGLERLSFQTRRHVSGQRMNSCVQTLSQRRLLQPCH
ncbi:unannotated protein [freshwater metagenome]|uniref:Unannotated protein n=1 Tax=freshwater metagenome TaxID=449393 RepID=A0A6J7SGD2_9ZZZZ